MEITPITKEEFNKKTQGRGSHPGEFTMAIDALKPGEGLSTPCKWSHYGSICGSNPQAHTHAKKRGYKIRLSCKDGIVLILKVAP